MGFLSVQIIPWNVADSNYVRFPSPRLDPKKTVFVGALHGMINAQVLRMSNYLVDLDIISFYFVSA